MTPAAPGRVRVIGGRWRGRRLPVPDLPGLRPTPDRVRETLFNWLAPVIEGAVCLDLFAGSGALGFEAASRGAGRVVMVEENERAVAGIRALAAEWGAAGLGTAGLEVHRAEALAWLRRASGSFDIVFLDPPYGSGLLQQALTDIAAFDICRAHGIIVAESAADTVLPEMPAPYSLYREYKYGKIKLTVYHRGGNEETE